jgi:hypothetical protein
MEGGTEVKEVTKYQCDLCNDTGDLEQIERCEKTHAKIKGIKGAYYRPRIVLPYNIDVEFDNGQVVRYVREDE